MIVMTYRLQINCSPEVLFESCVAMKFVDDDDDDEKPKPTAYSYNHHTFTLLYIHLYSPSNGSMNEEKIYTYVEK